MFNETAPVTGSWSNIIAMVRAMVAAGLCRVESIDRSDYAAVNIVLGDDSVVRAYYAQIDGQRQALRDIGDFRGADRLLCDYQIRSGSVAERPYSLSTNIYGWCMGSHLLSNLGGGKFAITDRGATLEECIAAGCDMARTRGTTLTFGAIGETIEQAAELVRVAGGTDEQVAWVLATPARKAVADAAAAVRHAQWEIENAKRLAFAAEQKLIVEAMLATASADSACRIEKCQGGVILRGKTYNPSICCTVTPAGFQINRTDFDGVRKLYTRVAVGQTPPTVAEVTAALQAAWTALKAAA